MVGQVRNIMVSVFSFVSIDLEEGDVSLHPDQIFEVAIFDALKLVERMAQLVLRAACQLFDD